MKESSGTKRSNSLVWKLVFIQIKRLFWGFFKVNIIGITACAAALMWWAEWQAAALSRGLEEAAPVYQTPSVSTNINDYPYGVRLDDRVAETFSLPSGSYRGFELSDDEPRHIKNSYMDGQYNNLHYIASIPVEGGGFYVIRIDLGTPGWLIIQAGSIVLLCELWYMFWTLFSAKRAVHKALRPIYDLTMTAQSITVNEPIPLDGAINTLNAINEEHLDRRISIEDERDELQGLAIAINSMLDRLDAAYQSQLRFVSDASHELRTPIAIIQGYANLLSRWGKDDPKTLQESVDAIKSEAGGMQSLIEQLLFLARSDNLSIPMHKERVNISALAEEVVKETRMIAVIHEITEKIEPELYAMADVQLIKQAMRILVDNSIKYSPEGGRIVIGVQRDAGKIQIRVTDNGSGISEQDLPFLFERFWRADESRARKTGGTGLGLSIAKWIADSHQGQIEVLSRKEMGTRMTILLPETQAEAPPLNAPADTQSA